MPDQRHEERWKELPAFTVRKVSWQVVAEPNCFPSLRPEMLASAFSSSTGHRSKYNAPTNSGRWLTACSPAYLTSFSISPLIALPQMS